MYWGVIVSRNSHPAGRPRVLMPTSRPPGDAQAFVDPEAAIQHRVIDQPFPADRCARLLEIDAHDDF